MATTEMRMVRWAMGVSLLEHRRNEEILEEAKVEAIATVMRRRRLEWFGHVKRRGETENIRAVAEMKMEGKRPRGRPKLRWKDTIRRDLKAWKIKEEWATDREKWKGLCKTRYPKLETAAKGEKGEKGNLFQSCENHFHISCSLFFPCLSILLPRFQLKLDRCKIFHLVFTRWRGRGCDVLLGRCLESREDEI